MRIRSLSILLSIIVILLSGCASVPPFLGGSELEKTRTQRDQARKELRVPGDLSGDQSEECQLIPTRDLGHGVGTQ